MIPVSPPKVETGFHAPYAEFAKTLRTWLVAYGVGAPVLFFQSAEAWAALGRNGAVRPFVYLFLGGIGLQVLSALAYKTAMWYLYMEELGKIQISTFRYRISDWLSEAYWLEALVDVATIALFGFATHRAISAVVQ